MRCWGCCLALTQRRHNLSWGKTRDKDSDDVDGVN